MNIFLASATKGFMMKKRDVCSFKSLGKQKSIAAEKLPKEKKRIKRLKVSLEFYSSRDRLLNMISW